MIKSFKDKSLQICWYTGNCKKLKPELTKRVLMKLEQLDVVTTLDDLRNPPSNHLHELKGEYKGYLAISVNGPWRLIFRFERGDIFDL
jgi:proteic killer suppression protein